MKNKIIDNIDLARRIRAAGRPIYIEEDDGETPSIPSAGLRIYQTGGVMESSAFDWGGGTGFKIYLVITSKLSSFAISSFELKLPWEQTYFQWLEDPLVIGGVSQRYRFIGKYSLEFERSLVINHYADVTRTISYGQSLKGFLLGFGYDPIPEQFRHGMMIPAFVIVYDQDGDVYRSPVELRADRMQTPPRVPRKRSLLDHPDKIVERSRP